MGVKNHHLIVGKIGCGPHEAIALKKLSSAFDSDKKNKIGNNWPGPDPIKNSSVKFDSTLEYWPIRETKIDYGADCSVFYAQICLYNRFQACMGKTIAQILSIPTERNFV